MWVKAKGGVPSVKFGIPPLLVFICREGPMLIVRPSWAHLADLADDAFHSGYRVA